MHLSEYLDCLNKNSRVVQPYWHWLILTEDSFRKSPIDPSLNQISSIEQDWPRRLNSLIAAHEAGYLRLLLCYQIVVNLHGPRKKILRTSSPSFKHRVESPLFHHATTASFLLIRVQCSNKLKVIQNKVGRPRSC